MLDKEKRNGARKLISETISDLVFVYFHGIRTEKDVKNVADTFREIATISTLNACILEGLLAKEIVENNEEAKK